MNKYKKYFPIFKNSPDLVYLDSAATSLKPKRVLDKMMEYYTKYSANIHRGLYPLSEKASEEYEGVRELVANFIGAKNREEIIFTSGTTAGINLVSRSWGEENIFKGDEIVATEMEHHSNLVPWQELAKRRKAKLRLIEVGDDFKLKIDNLEKIIGRKTKILALTEMSNVLGTINPVKEIIKKAKEINPKIVILVDGAQAVARMSVKVADLGADFYVFSGHKIYGPSGVGVLWVKKGRFSEMKASIFGGGMIREVSFEESSYQGGFEAYEAGTPAIGEVIGLGEAIKFVEKIGWKEMRWHESELCEYAWSKLSEIPEVKIIGPKRERGGVISIILSGKGMPASHDLGDILGRKYNVCLRTGYHCAMPLHKKFGLNSGTSRISLGIYNDKGDIDILVKGIKGAIEIFNKNG
ncbi:MAG: Cysteine desulfurase [Candidatus Shapirobacteria bacterium GW2011_GWE1_38_10]|uniref:cysteine desulfurase n=1 Tax=Candidatus Shapirobacteria bacterium GW2011_GWE1_38_10 TaxID=1618488 RepID=A0A0G0I8E9_9BACT|nr:MAG: Cysteine desulfurase [Candidatus Shapirobacteria bacterium GW2011_GWF2_37_20]KKQ50807.1 MAG: Cysteine desulfurase [Candidatus Shapirobacteria bacterium GW2011_GWE1_38_10]KKQ64894.1 MAG: Cysteine desulfurase [Candidatus Shapirobacteria bacterium GW2011_GWF1_38_23]HBP51016.1 cysteine desulfurase [Candidatus Shapirobacteria bacterium]